VRWVGRKRDWDVMILLNVEQSALTNLGKVSYAIVKIVNNIDLKLFND
jgi:hypothetical protein